MAKSEIEWTDATWNPLTGCTVISPGCTNCYAMRMAARLEAMGSPKYAGTTRRSGGRPVWSGQVKLDERSLSAPISWQRPQRIFVNSMSDLFHEKVSDKNIVRIWQVMERADWHIYQVLTKRPERMQDMIGRGIIQGELTHVWLGASVENADYIWRIKELRKLTRSGVRFISFEPLIAPVGDVDLRGVDWAIIGGESGPSARPMQREWVDQIHAACRRDGVAFFFKQWGGRQKKRTGRELYGRTWDEFPVTNPVARNLATA